MRSERGSALLLVVVLTMLLTVLGLGLTFSSLTEFGMSNEYESHAQALLIADAGVGAVKNGLRGQDLSAVLAASTSVPQYLTLTTPAAGTYAARNPIAPVMARNIDFSNPPQVVATVSVAGLFTPALGTTLGGGRYFAKFTDNDDGDGDLTSDLDGRLYARVIGIQPAGPGDTTTYGTSVKNSVAVIETFFRRDTSFAAQSPFTVIGQGANPARSNLFDGNAFLIDGFDHSGSSISQVRTGAHNHVNETSPFAGVSAINDDPLNGDASQTTSDVYDGLTDQTQMDNIIGADDGPYGAEPSIRDDTDLIRNSTNEDATNLLDPDFLATFVNRIVAAADNRYVGDTTLSSAGLQLGTEANPQITVVTGDLTVAGSGEGNGILVIKGELDYQGAFDFNGLILVVGEGVANFGGANKGIVGGLFVAKLAPDGSGGWQLGTPQFTLGGNTNFYFRGDSITMALTLLPMKTLMWREVVPEIEPIESSP